MISIEILSLTTLRLEVFGLYKGFCFVSDIGYVESSFEVMTVWTALACRFQFIYPKILVTNYRLDLFPVETKKNKVNYKLGRE